MSAESMYGVVSLIFWSVTVIVTVKYVLLVMRADNDGEGGIMALITLIRRLQIPGRGRVMVVLAGLGIFGASLFFGDSLITPAISVLSAVEGLKVVQPSLEDVVVPITAVIIVRLFLSQRSGQPASAGRRARDHRRGRRLQNKETLIGTSRRSLQRAGVRFRPRLVDSAGHTLRFADGTSLEASVVVWATGYRLDHSWIDVPGVLRDGRVIHTRGITEVPGLYFLGPPWQHTRGSALLGFVADDAAHVAAHVARTAATMNSGQVPRPPGAPDAQAAPRHLRT